MDKLLAALQAFDGKALSPLSEAIAQNRDNAGFIHALIKQVDNPTGHIASGVTWILKAWLEKGEHLSPKETSLFLNQLSDQLPWQAALHALQIIHRLDIAAGDAPTLHRFIISSLQHKRPFLRAWGMDALVALAHQHPTFRAEANQALQHARLEEAASVRARVRALEKIAVSWQV